MQFIFVMAMLFLMAALAELIGLEGIFGAFFAGLILNDYYLTAPEVEVQHGYCDFFLLPNLTHYKSEHSYILEVKYLPKKDFEAKAEVQWAEAVEQIQGYAAAPRVEVLRQGTRLHKIIMQFCGGAALRFQFTFALSVT